MAPNPQEQSTAHEETRAAADGDRVVISGMAGLYPQARYIKDLENILYNKLNPISADELRWEYNHPEAAQFAGNVPDLNRFDAQFFKVHYKLGKVMDSISRKLLEQAYEAIYDAGVNPVTLSGKKIGVYIGTCFSETEKAVFYNSSTSSGYGISGCNKSMFANRISYWLNVKGPSFSIDQSCCSSTAALEAAYRAVASGECEAALAGGGNLCLHPQSSVHYGRIMSISKDGKTKSFAEDAAGCIKSEAINCLFLQKAKDAKRIYADVLHVKTEFLSILNGEMGPKYGFYRNSADTAKFLKKFYDEAGVPPTLVEYVEAMGSAVPEIDKSELEALDSVFCSDKRDTLLVGSVMSNIGYGEAASGISAVTKVLLGFHNGSLAGNLHCERPRRDVAALREGRMRVVTDNQRFGRTYAAVNSMSVTGVNAHVLLHGHYKLKDLDCFKTSIPRLVTISSRQESSVTRALDHLKSCPIDPEEIALLHGIHETNTPGHLGRGYIIIDTQKDGKTFSLGQRTEYSEGTQRPLWFVYSGMGSQWVGMGAHLMRIPIFAAAIERCHKVLEPKGINIVHIITSSDPTIFDNILHSFVGISAVQIGLTDVLLQLGLVPDKIIGHSLGELGCAYADGCLTAEETILSAYSRGRVSLETPFIRGSMAAVGLGAKQMSSMCPPEIDIACNNSADSCTISGPAAEMSSFVAKLTLQGIFAKEVPCSNIAYHSRYIAEAGPGLLKYLKQVIKTPRARSERWISSSVPQNKWSEPAAMFSSAEYHTNNLLSPVLFEEASALIPADAVLVEVAPHGLLQAILKRALPDSTTNIPLTRRFHPDNMVMVLDAIGRLYLKGFNPKLQVLYPKVEFPVSTGTPFLSNYVDWAHQEMWALPLYLSANRTMTASCTFLMSIHDEDGYLQGHVIGDKVSVPISYTLVAVWDTLAMVSDLPKKSFPVQFRDVKLFAQPILHEQKIARLNVSLQRGNGRFEVMDEDSIVATGVINIIEPENLTAVCDNENGVQENTEFNAKEVYKVLYARGYAYSDMFRSIHSTNNSVSEAKILWNNNWVTFIDGLLQLNTFKHTYNGISQPALIGSIVIDHKKHSESISKKYDAGNESAIINAQLSNLQGRTSCGGVVIENVQFRNVRQANNRITLHTRQFVPRFDSKFDVFTSLYVFLQIAAENLNKDNMKVVSLNLDQQSHLSKEMEKVAEKNIPGIKIQHLKESTQTKTNINENNYQNADIILIQNLSKNKNICEILCQNLQRNIFIVNEEIECFSLKYKIVSVLKNSQTRLELAHWQASSQIPLTSSFTVQTESDLPLLKLAHSKCLPNQGFLIATCYPPVFGLMNVVEQWRKSSIKNSIYTIMVDEKSKMNNIGLEDMTDVNLVNNVYKNGICGGEYYLPVKEPLGVREKTALQCKLVGDLKSLRWMQEPGQAGSDSLVAVHYAGINIGDVKQALGLNWHKNNKCSGYGMDFSGITETGERVMGLIPSGAASSYVKSQPELTWPVPSHWSLEDAATVPLAYVYAYYCLVVKTAIRPLTTYTMRNVYSVLVHGGAGALGQAAISISLARGWRVFTTVSDSSKKRFLKTLFPQLNETDIGNSRDATFCDMILNATNGMGCNAVICCLNRDLKTASFKCCGISSVALDTVQILDNENFSYGMSHLTNEISYVAVDIKSIFSNKREMNKLHGLVSEGIARGEVRPLSRVTFAADEAPRAFRLLAASRHRGRALLRLINEFPLQHSIISKGDQALHIVICDSNYLGIQVADKLIDIGTKNLLLFFSNIKVEQIQYKLREWKKSNLQVTVTYRRIQEITNMTDMLHDAMNIGFIEGLHIIADNNMQESFIRKIDLAVRAVCPSQKRFMVLSENGSNGHYSCVKRATCGLPATLLNLSLLEKVQDVDGHDWYRGADVAIEQALQSKSTDTVLLALPDRSPRPSLIQQISTLAGLKIGNKQATGATSLEKLGISKENSLLVCDFLRDVYNVSFEEDHIPSLTLERINQIEENSTPKPYKELKGLETFYSFVDSDELLAVTEMIQLPTRTNNSEMRDDEFDMTESYLCILPGLEGHHARFRALCERLKLPAFVLQPGLDHPDETPAQLALRYSKVLLNKTCMKNKFYILGYETGVGVALELATLLEENGLTGTVFCLGDGPDETIALLDRTLSPFSSKEALQEAVARHMFGLIAHDTGADVARALLGRSSWRERVDSCVRSLLGHVPHSAQYARSLIEAAYARINAARRAVVEPRALRSRLVLLRARADTDYAKETCSLQRYSQQAIHVKDLDVPMSHAAADLRASTFINSFLDDDILQAFERRNLCNSYVANIDSFMATVC